MVARNFTPRQIMLDFTLVPKLLGFFQWNYSRELVLLRVFFFGERGGDGNRKLV